MASPYSSVSITGYNSNPPVDDGSQTEANRVKWSTIKTKLNDPVKTRTDDLNTELIAAFGKIDAGVTTTALSYVVLSTDQGKLVKATASGITITTPDATDVGSPFVFDFLNASSANVTFDGSGSQTVDGSASITVPAGCGFRVRTDGANWFTSGVNFQRTLAFSAGMINGTIVESHAGNAVTFAIKTLAGANPSAADPVKFFFRNATPATGDYSEVGASAATSFTFSSGSTAGFSNTTAGRLWFLAINNAGTVELAAINCRSGTNIYPLKGWGIITTTAEGGAGGADSAHVPYSTSARSSVPYIPIGYVDWESGLATAGTWNASPDRIQIYGPGVPLPGERIQTQRTDTGAVATGTTTVPLDDTIPQNTEGDQYMSLSITPTSAANLLQVAARGTFSNSGTGIAEIVSLFRDSTANALATTDLIMDTAGTTASIPVETSQLAGSTAATTFKLRAGGHSAGTTTFNGAAGARRFGGVANSFIKIDELMV